MSKYFLFPAITLVFAIMGCNQSGATAAQSDTLNVGVASQELSGANVATDSVGSVLISSINPTTSGGSVCSGQLLSPWWVVTAHHCVTKGGAATGGTAVSPVRFTVKTASGQSTSIIKIVRHLTLDVALLELKDPLMKADGTPFLTGIYRGTSAALNQTTLLCQGFGGTNSSGANAKVLRSSNLPVINTSDSGYSIGFGGNTPFPGDGEFTGDDGSACYINELGQYKITGVCGKPTTNGLASCVHTGMEAFRDWASGVMGSAGRSPATPVGFEFHDGITAVAYRHSLTGHQMALSTTGTGVAWNHFDFTTMFGVANVTGSLSADVTGDSFDAWVWRGPDSNVYEQSRSPSGEWHTAALTFSGGAAGDPAAYVRPGTVRTVVYPGNDGEIHELSRLPGQAAWVDQDISAATNNPALSGKVSTEPVGFISADGIAWVVSRVGSDIWAYLYDPADASVTDPPDHFSCSTVTPHWTAFKANPNMGSGSVATSGPRPYTRSDGITAIVYLGDDFHIHELSFVSFGGFMHSDLTLDAGASLASTPPVPYVREDGMNALLYVSSNSHLSELELPANAFQQASPHWQVADLNQLAQITVNPGQFGASVGMGFIRASGAAEVIFQGVDRHVYGAIHSGNSWTKDTSNSATGDLTPGGE